MPCPLKWENFWYNASYLKWILKYFGTFWNSQIESQVQRSQVKPLSQEKPRESGKAILVRSSFSELLEGVPPGLQFGCSFTLTGSMHIIIYVNKAMCWPHGLSILLPTCNSKWVTGSKSKNSTTFIHQLPSQLYPYLWQFQMSKSTKIKAVQVSAVSLVWCNQTYSTSLEF